MDTVDWSGDSGATYRYWFLSSIHSPAIIAQAGNYAFVKQLPNGNWLPLYFGVADDLRIRLPYHERWPEAVKLGATHVMAHATPDGDAARCSEERDLIRYWNPIMNMQHRSAL